MPRAPKRLEGDALTADATLVFLASKKAEDKLKHFFEQSEIRRNRYVYNLKSRVKEVGNLVRKVERKRRSAKVGTSAWHYEAHHVTDGCGFRIVTVFQSEITWVVEQLLEMFRHEPFLPGRIKEAVIYTNRPVDEAGSVHVAVRQLVEASGLVIDDKGMAGEIRKPENKKSGYSSVHFVVYVPVRFTDIYGRDCTREQPVEIQVRDIFEEAWGEIDHSLRYVLDRDGEELETGEDAEDSLVGAWKPHLNALKTFADGCSQHASLIKRNAIDAVRSTAPPESQMPVEDTGDVISELTALLPNDVRGLVEGAFAARDEGVAHGDELDAEEIFARAAGLFRALKDRVVSYLECETSDRRTVQYRLDMEYAYCLRTEDPLQREEALQIYDAVIRQFPDDATAFYRKAQALRSAGRLREAIEFFHIAAQTIAKDRTLPIGSWMPAAVLRNGGYTYWLLAEDHFRDGRTQDALEAMGQAIELCQQSIVAAENSRKRAFEICHSLNNLTWFLMRYLEWAPNAKDADEKTRKLENAIESLTRIIDIDGQRDLLALHTLMKGCEQLGRKDEMERVGNIIAECLFGMAKKNAGLSKVNFTDIKDLLRCEYHDILADVASLIMPKLVAVLFSPSIES